ncbi:MAG TPA: hypothetical protein VGB53_08545 [Rubricoccaceae bacterium]
MSARSLLALAIALAIAAPAWANMANPVQPGTPAGEPAAALAGLRIARETLTLDLRPLGRARAGDVRFATIEAVYGIVNDGAARRLPIEFVALGSGVEAGQVWVDERPVAAQAIAQLDVPALWTGIEAAPGFDGETVPYEADVGAARGLRFVLDIGPGLHRVRVRYRVRAGSFDAGDHPNRTWQVAYSLAPARLWAGFGQLDMAVLAPAGWNVSASLPLRAEPDAEGERLVGRFAGLPGDVLAVSARAPEPAGRRLLHGLAFLAALVVTAVFGALGGIAVGRLRRRAAWALPVSFLGGVSAAAALLALRSIADGLGDSAALGYGSMMVNVFVLGPAVLLLGTAIAQTVAARVARRVRRGRPGVPGPEARN